VVVTKYTKFQIASRQLETAIGLFVSGRDRLSAISLAGAADGILHALVLKSGREPFVEYSRRVRESVSGEIPPRGKYTTHINNILMINALKHMDEGDAEDLELDVDECAVGAILKAVANYRKLVESDPDFIKAFFAWTWQNMDGPKVMEASKLLPPKLRKSP